MNYATETLPHTSTLIFLWDQPKPKIFGAKRLVRPLGTDAPEARNLREENYYAGMAHHVLKRLLLQKKRRVLLLAFLRKHQDKSFSVPDLRKRFRSAQSTMNLDLQALMLQEFVSSNLENGRASFWCATDKKGEVE